ncbi:hypothetical protein BH24GEM2_BH24GEM2_01720 [soil metagenome]
MVVRQEVYDHLGATIYDSPYVRPVVGGNAEGQLHRLHLADCMTAIRCVCVARDEADVLSHAFDSALRWANSIYVLDNGSTDGTWELVNDYAARYEQVVVVGRVTGPFSGSLRSDVVNSVLHDARKGDWWCRLDADELYVDDPRDFLGSMKPWEKTVWAASIQYYFTDVDLAAYERDPAEYVERWKPELLRFYRANWSEPRFVRHVPQAKWAGEWPEDFRRMRASRRRIRLRHYQYRSPPQIQHRLALRISHPTRFPHERTGGWLSWTGLEYNQLAFSAVAQSDPSDWRSRVLRAQGLDYDDGSGSYRVDWGSLPRVRGSASFLDKGVAAGRRRWRRIVG